MNSFNVGFRTKGMVGPGQQQASKAEDRGGPSFVENASVHFSAWEHHLAVLLSINMETRHRHQLPSWYPSQIFLQSIFDLTIYRQVALYYELNLIHRYIQESKCHFWPKKSDFQGQIQWPPKFHLKFRNPGNIPEKYQFFYAFPNSAQSFFGLKFHNVEQRTLASSDAGRRW